MFELIKNKLGKPYFESKKCLIYNGDALYYLDLLPEEITNLTVTSPPYNIGKEYEKVRPLAEYLGWCTRWMNSIFRITKNNGALVLNLGYVRVESQGRAIPIPYLLWNVSGFFMLQEIVWHYGAGVSCKKMFSPRNEKFLWYVKNPNDYTFNLNEIRDPNVKYPNQKKNGKLKCNQKGKNPGDVWIFPKVTSGTNRSSKERTVHPAQFPLAVIDRFIKGMSNTGEIIFDPFLGSGTTCLSAIRNGRRSLCFEIEEKYCEIAARRIENFEARDFQETLCFDENITSQDKSGVISHL